MSIEFNKVIKKFNNQIILNKISFDVKTGEIFFIIGKSGVGKSVTLKLIVGLLQPDDGNILIDDRDVSIASEEILYDIRKKCGLIFQSPALFDSLNVFDNISFGLKTHQYLKSINRVNMPLSLGELEKIVLEKMQLVHLDPKISKKLPNELSFGIQKRISIARTLAIEPSYLLFDEPTTSLDPITTQAINKLIFELSRTLNVTSIVVSHDMRCALDIADRILVLDDGKILALGTRPEIKSSKNSLIQEFLYETLYH